ncbi:metallo-beta-lactamase superfamily protein [Delitschia confertaspora ATCC 74209]|uniref:Metallo-beta-lactamase superfamily protein n=1 Tax=Delitschia confertaspora ATCC 74209 TaxID=1513339 RepID=A0A9P4MZZ8_9PLEO|nr:metallo-beta-lactamase superfamily protein [Delitschia confertaspora ATCC 74209]
MSLGRYRQISKTLNICAFEDYLDTQQSRLPKLEDVEQISPRVIHVLGQNAGKFTLQGTNTYIVGTGSKRLLIDTGQGIPDWADLIISTLNKSSITLSHALTHWHGDHTGGVPDFIRLYPHLSNSVFNHSPSKDQQQIVENQVFRVEGATIRAVYTPGHSHDHMCFILEEEAAMFTGDNVLGHGTSAVEFLSTWMVSLQQMLSHKCAIGYPAHGETIFDLGTKIRAELAQKRRQKGSVTVSQLVTAMHGDEVDEQVRESALEPFTEEILQKLAEDKQVGFEHRRGEKRWFAVEMTGNAGGDFVRIPGREGSREN